MGHHFQQMSAGTSIKCRNLVQVAAARASSAHRAIINAKSSSAGMFDYRKWFGAMDTARHERVKDVVTMIDYALNSCSITFAYNNPAICTPHVNAAGTFPGGARAATIKEALASGTYLIILCPNMTNLLPVSSIEQSVLGTFLHEMSHVVGDTIDVGDDHISGVTNRDHPSAHPGWAAPGHPGEYYGADNARRLARTHPDWAVENAENYGFYMSCRWE